MVHSSLLQGLGAYDHHEHLNDGSTVPQTYSAPKVGHVDPRDVIAPMQYHGLGTFRPRGMDAPVASDFLFNNDIKPNHFGYKESSADVLPQHFQRDFLALVHGPKGWQWAQLPPTSDVVAALKSGQLVSREELADVDDEPPPFSASEMPDDTPKHAGSPLAPQQTYEDDGTPPMSTSVQPDEAPSHVGSSRTHLEAYPAHTSPETSAWHPQALLRQPAQIPEAPVQQHAPSQHIFCGLEPQNTAHSYSYTDQLANGQFASHEVATQCVDSNCKRIAHDIFPNVTSLGNDAVWGPLTMRRQSTGLRISQVLNRAFDDVSKWISNGLQENCGGRWQHSPAPSRAFSHSYVFSNLDGKAGIDEQETHCRDGHCVDLVKIARHLIPTTSDTSELQAASWPSKPSSIDRPNNMETQETPDTPTNSELGEAPIRPSESALGPMMQATMS